MNKWKILPTYLYKCSECENNFEEVYRIADRNIPVGKTCGVCGKGLIELIPQVPSVMYSMRDGFNRHTSDGFKDRMREIKRNHPLSGIDIWVKNRQSK